jgi:hypothetical protein
VLSSHQEAMMAMMSIRCPVLGAHVTCITDLEGNVVRILCGEYQEVTGACRLKTSASQGGPLSQLLERVAENTLASPGVLCSLRAA